MLSAVDQVTGKLDVSKFQQSIKDSGLSLQDYAIRLQKLGPEGEQAFIKIANAVALAEAPTKRLSNFWTKLWSTFGNTVRWQFTTGLLHTFTGQLSSAYRYAQDLDESLNNIRIVTGKSAEEMAKFAQQANNAAKTLSTTTTDYTNASLIYYQQGLPDQEVQARTDVTIKLANAAGESAEKASEQLTAIWNNFAEGSENLEYYADVMTALGASTASSTEEISSGLQKFASVASTVGLSYEYAASAMATITATTRESADVVGTALRTLFARIQGLSQDITQDDGTDLNKYSQALAAVGIQIKDTSGNLRDMDEILNDMAARWKTLSNAQQMALAQTVAGVRQYTQLITLMNNWDFFEKNLQTIEGSLGTLQEQQETFASGWEASRKRVKAAAEDIYDSIFQPETFINLNNTLSTVLNYIANTIDSLGGLSGILFSIGTLFVNTFGDRLVEQLRNAGSWFDFLTHKTEQSQDRFQSYILSLQNIWANSSTSYSTLGPETLPLSYNQVAMNDYVLQTQLINQLNEELTESQRGQLMNHKEMVRLIGEEAAGFAKAADEIEKERIAQEALIKYSPTTARENFNRSNPLIFDFAYRNTLGASINNDETGYYRFSNGIFDGNTMDKLLHQLNDLDGTLNLFKETGNRFGALQALKQELEGLKNASPETIEKMNSLQEAVNNLLGGYKVDLLSAGGPAKALEALKLESEATGQNLNSLIEILSRLGNIPMADIQKLLGLNITEGLDLANSTLGIDKYREALSQLYIEADQMAQKQQDWAANTITFARSLTSLTMMLNRVKSLFDIWNNDDLNEGEKLAQILNSIGMIILTLIPNIQQLAKASKSVRIVTDAAEVAAAKANGTVIRSIECTDGQTAAIIRNTTAWYANPMLWGTLAIAGIITGITVLSSQIEKQTEKLEEAAEKSKEYSDSLQEQVKTHGDLIKSMSDALDAYKENEDQKSALDEATKALTESYGIEGAALASLTGDYNDYLQILQKVKAEKRREELEEQQRAIVQAGNDQAEAINYSMNNFWASIKNAILHPSAEMLQGLVNASTLGGGNFQYDEATRNAINSQYAEFQNIAGNKTLEDWKEWQAAGNNIREDAVKTGEITQEEADKIANLVDQSYSLDAALKIENSTVSSLSEYRKLIEETENDLSNAGYDAEETGNTINSILNSSVNESILHFAELDQILKDIYNKNPLLKDGFLEETGIFDSDQYDKAVLSVINWATITEGSFQDVYSAAKQLSEAQMEYSTAKNTLNIAEELSKSFKGSDKSLNEDELKTLQGLDWESLKTDVNSFTEFLQLSVNDQQLLIDRIVQSSYERSAEATKNEIEALKDQLKELQAFRESLNSEENQKKIANAESNLLQYNTIIETVQNAINEGTKIINDQSARSIIENSDLISEELKEKLKNNTKEGLQDALDEFENSSIDQVAEWEYIINSIQASDSGIAELEKQIQNETDGLQIEVELKVNFQRDYIESYTDDWAKMYEAVSKKGAIQKQVDEIGNSFYTMSRDVAQSFEEIYPGFIRGLGMMKDGTFTMTQEMYEDFFGLSQGRIKLDTETAAHALEVEIQQLEHQRDELDKALAYVDQIKKGEITLYNITDDQKKTLLNAYEIAVKDSNGEILDDTVSNLQDDRTNWSYLATDIGNYMNTAAENSADSISKGTESIVQDMKTIQDEAWAAAQQIAEIGKVEEGGEVKDFRNTLENYKAQKHTYWLENTIDTSDSEAFINSLFRSVSLADVEKEIQRYQEMYNEDMSAEEMRNLGLRINNQEDRQRFFDLYGNIYGFSLTNSKTGTVGLTPEQEAYFNAYTEYLKGAQANIDTYIGDARIAESKLWEAMYGAIDSLQEADDQYAKDHKTSSATEKEPNLKHEDLLPESDRKDLEDDIERYHRINRLIQDQAEVIEDLDNAEERAYGKKRLEIYRKQIQENEKQLENYQKKLQRAEWYVQQDAQALADAVSIDVQFDADTGEILNYREVVQSLHDEYNSFFDDYQNYMNYYNSLVTEEDQTAAQADVDLWKEKKKEMDETYSANLKLIESYEDSIDQAHRAKNEIQDIERAIEDRKLKEITYKMDVVIEIRDAKNAANEFSKTIAEAFSDALFNQTSGPNGGTGKWSRAIAEQELGMLQHYQEEYAALQQRLAEATDPTSIEDIKNEMLELQQNIISSGEALLDFVESIEDMVPDAVDAARERFQKFLDQLEHNDTILNTIKELYVLQGQTYKTEEGFNRLQSNAQERMNVALAQARANKQWSAEAEQRLAKARAEFEGLMAEYGNDPEAAENDYRYDTYKKTLDAYLQEYNKAQEALYESAKEAYERLQEMYNNANDKIMYDFDQAVSGGLGLDLLQDKYDHYIEEEGRYFDKVNEGYQVSAWYLKLQEDIDKSTNPLMTKRLKALQDEIDLRREGNMLSEYDMEILEAKYKVLQAQMALEDEMNAKNELRLVRDRQGNWNYQYTADPQDIADKQQELLDAENEWYNIAKQQVTDVTQEIIDTWQECSDKIKEVYSDMTLTDQERADRAAEIYDYYAEKVKYLENEKQIAIADMTEAGNKDLFDMAVLLGDEVSDLTGLTSENIKSIIEQTGLDVNGLLLSDWDSIVNMTDQYGNNILDMIAQQSDSIADLMGDNRDQLGLFDNVFAQTVDDMTANARTFDQDLRQALDNAQQNFNNYQDTVDKVAGETGTTLEELDRKQEAIADSTQTISDKLDGLIPQWWEMIDGVSALRDEFLDLADSIWDAIRALEELAHAQAEKIEQTADLGETTPPNVPESNPTQDFPSTSSTPTPVTVPEDELGDMVGTGEPQASPVSSSDLEGLVKEIAINGTYKNQPVRHGAVISDFPNAYTDGKFDIYYAAQAMINNLQSYSGTQWYTKLSELISKIQSASDSELDTVIGVVRSDDKDRVQIPVTYRKIRQLLAGSSSFATGGYTGEFNGSRLAFLHEKELILNRDDTENMLNAVRTIRALSPQLLRMMENMLDSTAAVAFSSIGTRANAFAGSNPLEQNVHIEAVFPSVTDQYEIVAALNSLVNDASQHINRRTS